MSMLVVIVIGIYSLDRSMIDRAKRVLGPLRVEVEVEAPAHLLEIVGGADIFSNCLLQ